MKAKIVIGGNYGDEGKGLATDFFSSFGHTLNVLFNGGAQRGHTVDKRHGKKVVHHVFHHFGSGVLNDRTSLTFFDENFMLCPNVFMQEYRELQSLGVSLDNVAAKDCRITTPYDAFINQIVESKRDGARHGSCGFGIWETQKRYEARPKEPRFGQVYDMVRNNDYDGIWNWLKDIAENYLPKRLKEYDIDISEVSPEYLELINSEGLRLHFYEDIKDMCRIIGCVTDFKSFYKRWETCYDTVVFEGGQGLALDENNKAGMPHLTASNTTSEIPLRRLQEVGCEDVEVCYVTRSYFTRHGAGPLPSECAREEINAAIEDNTNVFNDYQHGIRYGKFKSWEFVERVAQDRNRAQHIIPTAKFSMLMTHLNYTNGDVCGDTRLNILGGWFDKYYTSDSKFAEEIKTFSN